jgi:aminopeptidase N
MAEVVLAGAMEHQTMTSYGDFFMTGDRYYEGIVAHELSHHWWGNLLTLTDWDDIWLHEGLATFSDGLWREYIDGRDAYLQFLRQRSAGCCGFYGPISPPSKLFNQTVYQKTAWMLHMLREYVGDTHFFAALRRLTQDPTLRYLKVSQVQDDEPWAFPLRIRLSFPSSSVDHDIFVTGELTELRVSVDEWPVEIELDPDEQLLFFDRGVEMEDPEVGGPVRPPVISNDPNPFNPRTAIRFALPHDSAPRLRVYDLRGRAVRTLDPGWLPAGEHRVIWEGDDDNGRSVASGNSLVRLEGTGLDVPAHRVTLVR